ncbi:MAG: glycosyltransferase [Chloroflexota bacterium]
MDVSIIIPTYNRPQALRRCLQGIAALAYDGDRFEVIVVDDGSDRAQENLLTTLVDGPVRWLRQANAGPAAARNAGAAVANGRLLCFTDDDCSPHPDWLAHLWAQFEQMPAAALGGRTINQLVDNPYAAASQLLIDYLYAYYRAPDDTAPRFFTSNNLAVPADLFRQTGGFDTTMPLAAGEDREFCERWRLAGRLLSFVPDALVHHAHPLTLPRFWRQHFNYGRGAWQFRQRVGAVALERWGFYGRLLSYPWHVDGVQKRPLLTLLLIISQLANAAGYLREQRRTTD